MRQILSPEIEKKALQSATTILETFIYQNWITRIGYEEQSKALTNIIGQIMSIGGTPFERASSAREGVLAYLDHNGDSKGFLTQGMSDRRIIVPSMTLGIILGVFGVVEDKKI